ncbi:MAG: DUF542 domain-containing protein [Phycisphaeraceae bacterium]|nr:DUF542 domain-containing protein [Phycisphaeraceae bacterium]MCW5769670.1 DUF542 domain-containing protein [Phycisphaeraceae bacterium]
MTIKASHETVGSIAVSTPEAVSVFMSHGLDFCCGGGRTLEQACAAMGLDAEAIRAEIQEAAGRRGAGERESWSTMGMSDLADHIEQVHHARARELILRVDVLLPRVISAHGDSQPELHAVVETFNRFRAELFDHMIREERVLFPWLRRLEAPGSVHTGPPWSVARPISCMVHDHDAAAAGLASMRSAMLDYAIPAETCGSYVALVTALKELDEDTRIHIHKENNALFPAGIRAEAECNARSGSSDAHACGMPDPVHSHD